MFARAKLNEWLEIQKVLDIYEAMAGQGINKSKTGAFFSLNTSNVVKGQIPNSSDISLSNNQEKYLSLPMMVGRNRYRMFEAIKEKVWTHTNNGKNTLLSQARKEILLRSVVQTIPTYAMSLFKLSRKTCRDISSLMAKF